MGTRNSRPITPSKEIQTKISTKTKEYENIKLHFQQLSKTYDISSGRISKEIFVASYLRRRLPSFSADLLERLFIVLAFEGKDYVVFHEFLQTKYLLEHIPPEPQQIIAKSADDFYTEEDIIYESRLRLVFNLFDLDFDGYISIKEYQKVLPIVIQNELCRKMDVEEMKEYDEWFEAISQFGMNQFDRQKLDRLSWRDFRGLARRDLTVKHIIDVITPKHDEYDCIKYAQAIQRKNQKKKYKKDRKKKEKLIKNKEKIEDVERKEDIKYVETTKDTEDKPTVGKTGENVEDKKKTLKDDKNVNKQTKKPLDDAKGVVKSQETTQQ